MEAALLIFGGAFVIWAGFNLAILIIERTALPDDLDDPGRGLSYMDEPAAVSVSGLHDGRTMPANGEGE